MSIQFTRFTSDQITKMAPDSQVAAAGKSLASAKHWQRTGLSEGVLWGECKGSAIYQVRIDLSSMAVKCSCLSRKQPCKHAIGLLLLTSTAPDLITEQEAPDWLKEWLSRQAAASKRKETRAAKPATDAAEAQKAARQKTQQKREAQIQRGLERLDLWLNDLVRSGLSSLETQPARFWEDQAARMVDAQAPGIAARLRRMAALPNASPDWPEKVLRQMGQIALLTQAYRRIDQLEASLQEDVRLLVGWTLTEEEVSARGEHVIDDWLILGQVNEDAPRGTTQRTWLLGAITRRSAVIEQYAPPGGIYPQVIPPGSCWQAEITYWPGAAPQRARIEQLHRTGDVIQQRLPGVAGIEEFFNEVAALVARQPWRERFLCAIRDVVPLYDTTGQRWYIRDRQGLALPLHGNGHWQLLALSGGHPVDFAGEWDGEALLPFGIFTHGSYYLLERTA
ncbi:MAG: SWIM zinc finger family protein [Ktedonobacteraceae bacterium]|nr:SWIM zinc finger family protein [Ktedonobacteraceae bacterium]